MNKPDGGPAFPQSLPDGSLVPETGMSLRDYFAAKAMPEAIRHERDLRASRIDPGDFRYESIAHAAYFMADAMLAERAK